MAFVPRVHNRTQPVANHALHGREQRENQARHLARIQRMGAQINNKWGQVNNGVTEQKKCTYAHIENKAKKMQLQDERYAEIELENYLLLTKLSKILERSHDPTKSTREWGGGVRLTANQVPVLDHCRAEKPGGAQGGSLSGSAFAERERIARDNQALVRRLQMCRPTYDRAKLEDDFRVRSRWLHEHANSKRPISANANGRPTSANSTGRPTSATAYGRADVPVRRRPQSAVVRRPHPPDGAPSAAGVLTGGRPQSAQPRNPRRPRTAGPRTRAAPMAPDPDVLKVLLALLMILPPYHLTTLPPYYLAMLLSLSYYLTDVLQVLDLLTSQMSGASTLGQMRVARDSLMQHEDPNLTHLASSHISLLDADGVELEVVRAARPPAAGDDARPEPVLLLVHGGLFMSGSPLAVRHLAARLSAELGVAVVTPKLRLAPEHPYPAALDDLEAAYAWLEDHGVGHPYPDARTVPPSRIGIFAESSGAALALAALHRRHAAGTRPPPCALALVSPWLDMTCSGGSFTVNGSHEP